MRAGTVLVVDDNPENRALAEATLDDEGIRVLQASSGAAALEAFAREVPDCVLLDIRMPGIDGITVCERLRELPGGERVAVLFLTAQRDVQTFDRALAAGGDDFVTKPFRPAELVVRIQTAMRLRRMAAEQDALTRELKTQRDELQRLQLQKEQLSAFLVHDLKNPVNAIALLAQRLVRSGVPGAAQIQDETRALSRMIVNLLDITRADEGRLAPARRPTDVRLLVERALDELRPAAAAANVSLVGDGDGEANLDAELVHRALVNLIENAVRHAPEGSTVRVSAARDEFRVADAGPGIAPSQREAIFERFATSAGGHHRGLGLAFCKVVAEAHGGRVRIEEASPGAVFVLTLS